MSRVGNQEIGSGFGRGQYIEAQRRAHGRKALCLLPGYVPREVLTALDLLGVELWGPPSCRPVEAARLLPSFVCSVVRHALQFFLDGGADQVDALVAPHTCDSLQALSSLLADLRGLPCPLIPFDTAKGSCYDGADGHQELRAGVAPFTRAELKQFIQACEQLAGRGLDPAALHRAMDQHLEADRLVRELYRQRASRVLGERGMMELMRAREYLQMDDLLGLLREALARVEQDDSEACRVPVLLSGLVPEPMEMLDALEEAGLMVVADDLLCMARRGLPPHPPKEERLAMADPRQRLLELYAACPPCPTRGSHMSRRISWLLQEVHRSRARGVVFLVLKFCEPELFDLPALQDALVQAGTPYIVLEHELGAPCQASLATRLEAFGEMLREEAGSMAEGGGPC